MFYSISKIGWFVAQPLVVIILLGLAGVILARLGFRWTGQGLVMLAGLALILSALSPAGLLMMAFLEDRFPRPALPERVAGIVVLGGAFDTRVGRTRGLPELNEAADRMTEAMALARRYPDARILFSGGVAAIFEDDMPETEAARQFFEAQDLDMNRLILDGQARNTFENAAHAQELADPKPGEIWLLVTSAFHMPRAVGCFRQAGFPVLPFPVDYRTPSGSVLYRPSSATPRNLDKVHIALREYIGLLAYRLSGRTDALVPAP